MATNKTVFFMIGVLLVVLGVFMLAPYIMQLIYNENNHSFISSAFVTIFRIALGALALVSYPTVEAREAKYQRCICLDGEGLEGVVEI